MAAYLLCSSWRDFLHLWTADGGGTTYFRFLDRARDEDGTYLYLVDDEPLEATARKVWCFEDHGRPWTCEACGEIVVEPPGWRRASRPVFARVPANWDRLSRADRDAFAESFRQAIIASIAEGATIKAETREGTVRFDPSPEQLVELVRGLDYDDRFLIVSHVADPQCYAQVLLDHDGTWVAEYRDGDADHHFQALTPDRGLVEAFLTGWLTDQPGWRDALVWRPLALG